MYHPAYTSREMGVNFPVLEYLVRRVEGIYE
jgi:hypothetical protein